MRLSGRLEVRGVIGPVDSRRDGMAERRTNSYEGGTMTGQNRLRYLRVALVAFGIIFVFGLYALMQVWPSGWTWEPRQSEYEQMMIGIYATLGVFLILAARNPLEHLSLIWFTVWSSLVHGGIMAVQAFVDAVERPNLLGDIPALLLVAVVLGFLTPRGAAAQDLRHPG
jgi:hypothetical protein